MSFNRRCDNEEPHTSHVYVKRWNKSELTLMPELVKDMLPEEWNATYHCPGIEPEPIDPELQAAIETYESHQWDATSQLCECGEHFEASNVGHTMHRRHRMAAVRDSFKLPKLQHVKDEIRGLMDSLDDSVIKDEDERLMVYRGLHVVWLKL